MQKRSLVVAVFVGAFAAYLGWSTSAAAQEPQAQAKGGAPKGKQGGTAGTESGWAIFQGRCMGCHGNPNVERAPSPDQIREMTPERIYTALTTGVMKGQGDALSEDQKRMTAAFMSGRPLGTLASGDAKDMPNHCASNPQLGNIDGAGWNGWGNDSSNTRFQTAKNAGLTAAQVPRLKLKWAFGFPNGLSAYGQPSVVAGRVFVGTDTGYIYSLDAKSGCVYWSFQTKAAVRNAMLVAPVKGRGNTKYGVFFGDFRANAYAVDAQTGALLWTKKVDDHVVARITAAPAFHDGTVFVPVSSSEEYVAGTPEYPCCTSRGSVVALDASTGEQKWKAWVMEEPKPVKKNSKGTQLWAPAGGSVWNTPTIDAKLNAIYFGTGDAETYPASKNTDAIMAVDIKTGKTLWVFQIQENDSFLGGCGGGANKSENCPEVQGPDLDIGNSPILRTLPGGKRVLLTAAKDARVVALDPDNKGAVVWRSSASPNAGGRGGVVWGGSADERAAYYGLSSGGMTAMQLTTGERLWHTELAKQGQRVNNAAATSAIPGVAFVGGSDGVVHALQTSDGKEIWQVETAHDFETVNKVPGKGGAINSAGVTVVNGMVYVGSGYAVTGSNTGNVVLAFGVE